MVLDNGSFYVKEVKASCLEFCSIGSSFYFWTGSDRIMIFNNQVPRNLDSELIVKHHKSETILGSIISEASHRIQDHAENLPGNRAVTTALTSPVPCLTILLG
jgi:hypothetical protein